MRNVSFTDGGGTDEPKHLPYNIYVVMNELYEGFSPLEPFICLSENFGGSFGSEVHVRIPLPRSYERTRRAIIEKQWSAEVRNLLEDSTDPCWLVTMKVLSRFSPTADRHALLWFPEAIKNPDRYAPVLKRIEKHIKGGGDLISWVEEHNRRRKYQDLVDRLDRSVEMKLGAFGFSIDLKALLRSEQR